MGKDPGIPPPPGMTEVAAPPPNQSVCPKRVIGNRPKLFRIRLLWLFGPVLKVVLPDISPVSMAGIFRGQHSVLWCSWLGSGVFMVVRWAFVFLYMGD